MMLEYWAANPERRVKTEAEMADALEFFGLRARRSIPRRRASR